LEERNHDEDQTPVPSAASFNIDMGQPLPLPDGKTLDTTGLTVRAAGTTLVLRLAGDKSTLPHSYMLMGYNGRVR